jgi:ankyrin repeat protein
MTVLQVAMSEGSIDLVRILLEAGADINAPIVQEEGMTILQAAMEYEHSDLVMLLLDKGADVNAPAGQTYDSETGARLRMTSL